MCRYEKALVIVCTFTLVIMMGGCTRCVKFNTLPPTTEWGTPAGHSSGDLVHNEDGIEVSVHDFHRSATQTQFGETRLQSSFTGASGKSMMTNDINLGFDFTNLFFTPNEVVVIFWDTGGIENISINDNSFVRGELASGSVSGVNWTVIDTPQPGNPSNRFGTLTIDGSVETLKIGGQELWIDSVCAKKK